MPNEKATAKAQEKAGGKAATGAKGGKSTTNKGQTKLRPLYVLATGEPALDVDGNPRQTTMLEFRALRAQYAAEGLTLEKPEPVADPEPTPETL